MFIGGYLLAIITGLWFEENGTLIAALVILGLLVGLFNVTHSEMVAYLVDATAPSSSEPSPNSSSPALEP